MSAADYRVETLVDACHKRSRPIVMTTIAMGAGMLPMPLGWGSDPSFRSPMAIAVIGGLITSTLLSLLVVPAVFTYVDDAARWVGRIAGGRCPNWRRPAEVRRITAVKGGIPWCLTLERGGRMFNWAGGAAFLSFGTVLAAAKRSGAQSSGRLDSQRRVA